MKIITDEFSALKISDARRYQMRHERDGLCRLCSTKAAPDSRYCPKHLKRQRRLCARTKPVRVNPADLI